MHYLGIDIGGTNIGISMGLEDGSIVESGTIPTQAHSGPKQALDRIIQAAKKLIDHYSDVTAIGLSVPGPMSVKEEKILNPPNLPGWENIQIVKLLKQELSLPTFINNDANACVLAEWEFGSAKGCENLLYLTMSTGVGGGIIANGALIQGHSDTAGEVGHMVLDPTGPQCVCGLKGCLEIYCGGGPVAKSIQKRIRDNNIETKMIALAENEISKIDMKVLIKAVKEKDPFAIKYWESFIERLGHGIGTLVMLYNPEAIILGTIAIHAQDLLLLPLRESLKKYCWSRPLKEFRLEASSLEKIGDLSALTLAIHGHRKTQA